MFLPEHVKINVDFVSMDFNLHDKEFSWYMLRRFLLNDRNIAE